MGKEFEEQGSDCSAGGEGMVSDSGHDADGITVEDELVKRASRKTRKMARRLKRAARQTERMASELEGNAEAWFSYISRGYDALLLSPFLCLSGCGKLTHIPTCHTHGILIWCRIVL